MTNTKSILLAATLLLAGCSDPQKVPNGTDKLLRLERVIDFKLEDGTRCVMVADNRTVGGITCDWRRE